MKNRISKRITALVVAVAACFTVFTFPVFTATVNRPTAKQIPSKTLIIGTYIIELDSLTTVIYNNATASGQKANQFALYYKSEMSGGQQWYDITEAYSLEDIDKSGIKVNDSVIDKLELTHWVKERKVYDLKTGNTVDILASQDPWNPVSMSELASYVELYESGSDDEKGFIGLFMHSLDESEFETGPPTHIKGNQADFNRHISDSESVFKENFVPAETIEDLEKQMAALSGFYNYLISRNTVAKQLTQAEELRNDVLVDMKIEAYTKMAERAERLTDLIGKMEKDGKDIAAISSSFSDTLSAIYSTLGRLPSEKSSGVDTSTMLGIHINRARNDMVSAASSNNYSSAANHLGNYYHLVAIQENDIKDASRELVLVRDVIIDAINEFLEIISGGDKANEVYQQAVATGEYETSLTSVAKTETDATKAKERHIEFLIDAEKERCEDAAEMQRYISERLNQCLRYANSIPNDSFKEAHSEYFQDLLEYLGYTLSENTESDPTTVDTGSLKVDEPDGTVVIEGQVVPYIDVITPDGGSERVYVEPAEDGGYRVVPEGRPLRDVDGEIVRDENGNTVAAENVPEEVASDAENAADAYTDAQKAKDEAQKKLDEALAEGDSQKAAEAIQELADAQAKIDGMSPAVDDATKAAAEIADEVKEKVKELLEEPITALDLAEIENAVKTLEGVAELAPDKAASAAAEIVADLVAARTDNPIMADSFDSAIAAASEVVAGIPAAGYDAEESLELPWNENFMPSDITSLMQIADALLPDAKGRTIVKALVLISAAETGNYSRADIGVIRTDLINYSYKKPIHGTFASPATNAGELTVPADIMCESLGWRYSYNPETLEATISRGAEYYTYTVGSPEYVKNGSEKLSLGYVPEFRDTVCYLTESHMNEVYLGYRKYLPSSGFVVIYNDDHLGQAEEIAAAILGE
ncbi:MAG: hypothetical protein IJC39_04665 [Firmicutes bacterium]|nr:hypothetical protein [Bacillota bacterium]